MPSTFVLVGCVFAGTSGALLATQSGINAMLGKHVGRSFAAVVSFAVGLAALGLFCIVDIYGVGGKGPTIANMAGAPWWAWIGGLLGAFYVASVIIFVQALGAGTLMAIFVICQLATSVLLDALGLVGLPRRPLHWARLVGLALMVVGVVLVAHFAGTAEASKVAPSSSGDGPVDAGALDAAGSSSNSSSGDTVKPPNTPPGGTPAGGGTPPAATVPPVPGDTGEG